jgi:hypothetical protein
MINQKETEGNKMAVNVNVSIVDYMKSIGKDSSFASRKQLAAQYGITNYTGTDVQNTMLLNTLKKQQTNVNKPKVDSSNVTPRTNPDADVQPYDTVSVDADNQVVDKTPKLPQAPAATATQAVQTPVIPDYEFGRPAAYQSGYTGQINSLLGSMLNRQPFQYDVNTDPLYAQSKDQYTRQADLAMRDTVGNLSALSGGYGNSYAGVVGSQARDAALTQLNNVIPQLYEAARSNYQFDVQNDSNNLNTLQNLDNAAYGQYRDTVGDWYNDRNYGYQKDIDNRNYQYQVGRDQVADNQWDQNYNEGVREYNNNFEYQQGRDQVADQQYQQSYDRNVLESDRNYNRGVYENNRDYNRGVYEDNRDYKYNASQDAQNRQDSIDAQKISDASAYDTSSQKKIESASSYVDNMLNTMVDDGTGGKTYKYTVDDVWNYLMSSGLSDEEIATVINGNYELQKYADSHKKTSVPGAGGGSGMNYTHSSNMTQ